MAPSDYLGASKLAAETIAWPISADNFELSILRLFTPYGPGQTSRRFQTWSVGFELERP